MMRHTVAIPLLGLVLMATANGYGATPPSDRLYLAEDPQLSKVKVWDQREDNFVHVDRQYYDQAVQKYQTDQANHASAKVLRRDQKNISLAKHRLDLALAEERRSQRHLDMAMKRTKTNSTQIDNNHARTIDERLQQAQTQDQRADALVRQDREAYDAAVRQLDQDKKSHAAHEVLDRDHRALLDAKHRFDLALNEERRSQRFLNQAQKTAHR